MSDHCGRPGYEPGAGAAAAWKTAWTVVGRCDGTIGPTASPALDPARPADACADAWTGDVEYEEGDAVSVLVSTTPERKVAYLCKAWPYSGYCSKFSPTIFGGNLGWTLAGSCSGSPPPTPSPIVYNGSCTYTRNVVTKSASKRVSCANGSSPDCTCDTGEGGQAICTKPMETVTTTSPAPVNVWAANKDYAAGDVVRLGRKRFKCKEWPFDAWCKLSAYQPHEKHGMWADAWTEDGVCLAEYVTPIPRIADVASGTFDAAECLYQRDFDRGTKVITKSGSYKLCEDIVFAPGAPDPLTASDAEIAHAFDPATRGDEQYHKKEFGLGFFAALAIAADDVTLLLNGYTIQQGRSHALLQRFFAVIELASSPFIPKVGPADFVSEAFVPARNFRLQGPGTVGLSSHHGIHGNNNRNVVIENVIFRDFEVAAVSLNNVDGLTIDNNVIPHNRLDVPILGAFSAALFMTPYLRALKNSSTPYSMPLRGVSTSSTEVYDSLVSAIATVYRDVMSQGFIDPIHHPEEYGLFHNPHHVVDGPCYAFLVHGKGPAVGGQGFEFSDNTTATSSNVTISRNNVKKMVCWTNEIPSVVINGTVQNDARGAIIQLLSTVTNSWLASDGVENLGKYTGNVVADAQIMVASAIHDGVLQDDPLLQVGVNTIAPEMVAWATNPSASFVPSFRCNGDTMHHVVKGSIMIRVEDTEGFHIKGNAFRSALVKSGPAAASSEYFSSFPGTQLQWQCADYHKGASIEDGTEQQLGNLRGISVAAVSGFATAGNSTISGNTITQFQSEFANFIVGIDIQGMSEGIDISGNYVDLQQGVGFTTDDEYIACRVRKFVSQESISKADNTFFQEELLEQVPGRRLRSRKMPTHHPLVENEWEYGGCPFGRA